MINMLTGLDSTSSALNAERIRMDVVSQNIANVNTTRGLDGKPYARQQVVFEAVLKDQFKPQLPLRDALALGRNALQRAAEGQPRVGPENLEACILERSRAGRKFRRLPADVLRELLGS